MSDFPEFAFWVVAAIWFASVEYRIFRKKRPLNITLKADNILEAQHKAYQDMIVYGSGYMTVEEKSDDN